MRDEAYYLELNTDTHEKLVLPPSGAEKRRFVNASATQLASRAGAVEHLGTPRASTFTVTLTTPALVGSRVSAAS